MPSPVHLDFVGLAPTDVVTLQALATPSGISQVPALSELQRQINNNRTTGGIDLRRDLDAQAGQLAALRNDVSAGIQRHSNELQRHAEALAAQEQTIAALRQALNLLRQEVAELRAHPMWRATLPVAGGHEPTSPTASPQDGTLMQTRSDGSSHLQNPTASSTQAPSSSTVLGTTLRAMQTLSEASPQELPGVVRSLARSAASAVVDALAESSSPASSPGAMATPSPSPTPTTYAATEPSAPSGASSTTSSTEAEASPSLPDLIAALRGYSARHGIEAARRFMESRGHTAAGAVPADARRALITALQA